MMNNTSDENSNRNKSSDNEDNAPFEAEANASGVNEQDNGQYEAGPSSINKKRSREENEDLQENKRFKQDSSEVYPTDFNSFEPFDDP